MTSQVRHAQLFNLLKTSTAVKKPKRRRAFLDDKTALRLLKRADQSWHMPMVGEDTSAAKAQSDDEFFRAVRP